MGAEQFIGSWNLVSFETRRSDGTVDRPLGEKPAGQIMWDNTGHFSAQLMHEDQVGGGVAPGGDTLAYVAYFGTYTVDEAAGTMTHHVGGSLMPAMMEMDQVRHFSFNNGLLELRPPLAEVDGVTSESVLAWRQNPVR